MKLDEDDVQASEAERDAPVVLLGASTEDDVTRLGPRDRVGVDAVAEPGPAILDPRRAHDDELPSSWEHLAVGNEAESSESRGVDDEVGRSEGRVDREDRVEARERLAAVQSAAELLELSDERREVGRRVDEDGLEGGSMCDAVRQLVLVEPAELREGVSQRLSGAAECGERTSGW